MVKVIFRKDSDLSKREYEVELVSDNAELYTILLTVCKGSFQKNLIKGVESWSCATLIGKAASESGNYKKSRDNLLKRINELPNVIAHYGSKRNRKYLVEVLFEYGGKYYMTRLDNE